MSNFKKDILHENEDKSDVRLNRFLSDDSGWHEG